MTVGCVAIHTLGVVVTGCTPTGLVEWASSKSVDFVTPANIDSRGSLTRSERAVVPDSLRRAQVVPPNSVLFVGIGATLGKVALTERAIAINQQLHAVLMKDRCDAEVLREVLACSTRKFWRRAGNGGMPILTKKAFAGIYLPWPDSGTRQAVYRILCAINRVSTNTADLLQRNAKLKQALAQQLLTGKKRLPEFRGKAWAEVRLGDVFDERVEVNRGDLPLLSVTGDRGVVPRGELAKRDTSNPDKSKYKRVAVGDIAYNTMRMWQGVSALSALEGIVSPAYTVAVPGKRIDGRFAKHLFKLPAVVHVFHRHSQGLVDDTLNLKYNHFARIRLQIPSDVEEQRRIAGVLDLCDAELALLAQHRDLYTHYKRGLMARLLSGEIQVPA